jgi:hypothetical protein
MCNVLWKLRDVEEEAGTLFILEPSR